MRTLAGFPLMLKGHGTKVSWRGWDASTTQGGSLRSAHRFALHDSLFLGSGLCSSSRVYASRVYFTRLYPSTAHQKHIRKGRKIQANHSASEARPEHVKSMDGE